LNDVDTPNEQFFQLDALEAELHAARFDLG
jgi:hypothetical protein